MSVPESSGAQRPFIELAEQDAMEHDGGEAQERPVSPLLVNPNELLKLATEDAIQRLQGAAEIGVLIGTVAALVERVQALEQRVVQLDWQRQTAGRSKG